jgi:NAD(P)-dependent dehydrogenase (short-subunit alcohol dehydrogenase family)
MVKSRSLLFVVVAFVAVWLGIPHRQLDWQGDVLPMAHKKMGLTSPTDTPLAGIVVVITGSTSGIGLALTESIAKLGATVVAIGRSKSKLTQLQHDVEGVIPIVADLNDLQSVAKAADEIREKFDHIDILINNAGMHYKFTLHHPSTPQGYDQVFSVNYLSHFLLTEKMIPLLKNSTRPTLIEMSSSYHWAVDGSDLMPFNNEAPIAARPGSTHILFWRDQRSYANSKLAQILNMRALQRQDGLSGIRMVSVCPGWVGTQIAGKQGSAVHFILNSLAFDASSWGLASTFHAMFDSNDDDFYISSKFQVVFRYLIPLFKQPWTYRVGLRDLIGNLLAFAMILGQKFVAEAHGAISSPESYNVTLQDSLYTWSKQAVAEFL